MRFTIRSQFRAARTAFFSLIATATPDTRNRSVDDKPAEVAGLIDPPFGLGVEAWRKFKAEMEKQPHAPDVQDFIEEADREIKALERGQARWVRPPPPEAEGT